jgi:hypothetical protein
MIVAIVARPLMAASNLKERMLNAKDTLRSSCKTEIQIKLQCRINHFRILRPRYLICEM